MILWQFEPLGRWGVGALGFLNVPSINFLLLNAQMFNPLIGIVK